MTTARRALAWLGAGLVGLGVHDLLQGRHAIIRNFPVVGHLRYLLEAVGPELRQYIVTDNDDERPFTRDERRWVYSTAKSETTSFGFGTDNDLDTSGHFLLRHAAFPVEYPALFPEHTIPMTKTLGGWRERPGAFVPASIVNVSGMSFGSLSGPTVEAVNRGAAAAGCLHNTGEGGISHHHLHGAALVWQLGTGYFGARDADGRVDLDRVVAAVERFPVRAIEVKLSQGAKPGLGGTLPGPKVSEEIATIRGVPVGVTVHSPARHSAFDDVAGLVDFVEHLAAATGLPVGIKSAVGEMAFWDELGELMARTRRGPDFVTIDGAEGGTGSAPLAFTDHVALPFFRAFSSVHARFARHGLDRDIVFIGSGKLGLPFNAALAMAMGCDGVNVAREAMLSIGCIQAQRCHTGRCPTGVATQNRWLARGLDPTLKSVRAATFLRGLRWEVGRLAAAAGAEHPSELSLADFEVMVDRFRSVPATEIFDPGGVSPG